MHICERRYPLVQQGLFFQGKILELKLIIWHSFETETYLPNEREVFVQIDHEVVNDPIPQPVHVNLGMKWKAILKW